MSKREEKTPQDNTRNRINQNNIPITYLYLNKNILKEKSKNSPNIKEKEKYKKKSYFIPKNGYVNNNSINNKNIDNITNNEYDSRSIIINTKNQDDLKKLENQKNIALSNKIEKNRIPIFDKKLLIINKEKANPKTGRNYVLNKEIRNNKINIENSTYNINRGYLITTSKSKRILPIKYQLNLDNNNNCSCYNNNSIMISNNSKGLLENKVKIIKLDNKFDYINNLFPEKGWVGTSGDNSFIMDKKKSLKKCLSKPNYTNVIKKDNNKNNNSIHNILYSNKSNEKFNFDKYKKQQHNTSNIKNNNFHSYQIQAPPRNINHSKKKSTQQTRTINLKNSNSNNKNNTKIFHFKKCSYQNYFERNQNPEKRSKSRGEAFLREMKMKNQVNNNNININNVFINLESINDDIFNSTEDKTLIKEHLLLNKRSYSITNIKSNNKNDINVNNNQIINEIKTLWKKIGGINEQYKINFIETLNNLNNDDKQYLYMKEKEEITNLLNILDKLNKNIEKRKSLHMQIKNISNQNYNDYVKIEDISKLLNNLRISSITIIKDVMQFKKEISYDIMNNKYNLSKILHFPYDCLINIENDMTYLSSHEYLSSLFKFSKNPDPFLLMPSKESKDTNKNYRILSINNYLMKEIQKANYFLMKEKIYREIAKRNSNKNFNLVNNNSLLIRNMSNTNNVLNNKNKLEKTDVCSKVNDFEIIDKEIKKFKNNKIKSCFGISRFNILKNSKSNHKLYIPCFSVFNYEYKNNKINKADLFISNNNNFEIIKSNDRINKIKDYSISGQISNFAILKSGKRYFNNDILACKNITNLEIKSVINNNINQPQNNNINQNQINNIPPTNIQSPNKSNQEQTIQQNIKNNIPINKPLFPPNQILCPYNEKTYPPIDILYKAYLATVNNDIKISFKIMPDIHYYASIGCSPKIILFKENGSILYGMATLSYDPSQLYKKVLVITSISCANNYSITNTLLQLVEYCNKTIEYDELVLYLYFYENENKKGEYLLNEEYKNMIKTKTLFKWTALENSGNERKIKYHYKKTFDKNYKKEDTIKILNNYIHIKFYRFIKYNTGKCELGLTTKEYTYLFNLFELIYRYCINLNDKSDELNKIFTKLEGLKKKRLLKIITEFNFPICNTIKPFLEELSKSNDKLYSNILLKRFIGLLQNMPKDKPFNSLGFYCCDISTNFSSVIKRKINECEYNIISIHEFNIETFRLNNDINNEDYNNFIYFFKSQNESISFLVYELNSNEEKNIVINNIINNDFKSKLFYKLLKRILTKDNDAPVKIFKKIGIPSFNYYVGVEKEKGNLTNNKIADYEIMDGNDWFNFCIENNNQDNLFSFPEEKIINEDIKIINNSFIIAIINPELTVDYQIPALNIYYINKNCWIKR